MSLTTSKNHTPGAGVNRGTAKHRQGAKKQAANPDEVYDEVVHAGEREPAEDVFERLERSELNVDGGVTENLDPEDLVAQLEGKVGERADTSPFEGEFEEDEVELLDIAASNVRPNDEQDTGSVTPEELGEQFLRGAVQQDLRSRNDGTETNDTEPNDTEPDDSVDVLSNSVHQASLFDHNHDPWANPQFPQILTDETNADAAHHKAKGARGRHAGRSTPTRK